MSDPGPVVGITASEAAAILGVTPHRIDQMVCDGQILKRVKHARRGLEREDVENVALERGAGYWVDTGYVAAALGVTRNRVRQLIEADRIPATRDAGGRWRMRKHQVDVIIHARLAHRGRQETGRRPTG